MASTDLLNFVADIALWVFHNGKSTIAGLVITGALIKSKKILQYAQSRIPILFKVQQFDRINDELIKIQTLLDADRIYISEVKGDFNNIDEHTYMRAITESVNSGIRSVIGDRQHILLNHYATMAETVRVTGSFVISSIGEVSMYPEVTDRLDYFGVRSLAFYPIKNTSGKVLYLLCVEYVKAEHVFTPLDNKSILSAIRKIRFILFGI